MNYQNEAAGSRITGGIATPTSRPPLEQALAALDIAVDRARSNVDALFTRLDPLLNQAPSTKQPTSACAPPSGNSALIEKLDQLTMRLETMNEMLAVLHARLEV